MRRRAPSPYGAYPASLTPEAMQAVQRTHAVHSPAAAAIDSSAQTCPAQGQATSSWQAEQTSPFLADPEGYATVAGGTVEEQALAKYHFSLSWNTPGAPGQGSSALAPSGPRQIEDVLLRLDVDRTGLRCAALFATKHQSQVGNGVPTTSAVCTCRAGYGQNGCGSGCASTWWARY